MDTFERNLAIIGFIVIVFVLIVGGVKIINMVTAPDKPKPPVVAVEQTVVEDVKDVELRKQYVLRHDTDNPWYDGSQDLYGTPIETKERWVRILTEDEHIVEMKIENFLKVFEKAEE